jgi:predicted transposase/invertase (TIGR01784 family)
MGLQWIRPKFIASVVSVCVLISGESQGSFLMKELIDGMRGLSIRKKPHLPKNQHRSFVTSRTLHQEGGRHFKKLIGKQIFAHANYDSTAKYVLQDNEVRLEFIKTFAKLPNVVSTQLLDNHLNPLKRWVPLRKALQGAELHQRMKEIQEGPEKREEALNSSVMKSFIDDLAPVFEDFKDLLPQDRDSKMDVLCRLSTDDYAVVEIQVVKKEMWDERALAYTAGVYANQLRSGQSWKDLKKVIGINILGAGPEKVKYWPDNEGFMRHYRMRDDHNPPNEIPHLQLIQYSLENIKGDEEELQKDKNLKEWLDYFRDSSNEVETPQGVNPALKKAYELIRIDNLSPDRRSSYEIENAVYTDLNEYTASVREKGKIEGKKETSLEIAKRLLKKNLSLEDISSATDLTEEEIKKLQ